MKEMNGLAGAPPADARALSLADDIFGPSLCDVGAGPVREAAAPAGAGSGGAGRVGKKVRRAPDTTVPSAYTGPIEFTILGQPASKANRKQIVTIAGRAQLIKSKEALAYEEMALAQVPPKFRLQLTCKLAMELRMFYASELSDMDEALVLDVLQNRTKLIPIPGTDKKKRVLLQAGVYVNDRQVRERHVYHGIDAKNPRTELRIWSIEQQEVLL